MSWTFVSAGCCWTVEVNQTETEQCEVNKE